MKDESLIHLKFEYTKALQSKRDILLAERSLLRAEKAAKQYRSSRIKELEMKLRLYRKMRELNAGIAKIQKALPKIKIPEILKKDTPKNIKKEAKKTGKENHDESLEYQLKAIQEKLNSLAR